MFRLVLFGGIELGGPSGPLSGRIVRPRPLALLALLARECSPPITRAKAASLLWTDTPEARARRRLSDVLYVIRRELGEEAVEPVADRLRLDPARVGSDAGDFDRAMSEGRLREAVELYGGPFLDGFHLGGGGSFDRWAEEERLRLAQRFRGALERLAAESEAAGDPDQALLWWRRRALEDPTDSRVALHLMEALVAAGNAPGAVEHARAHALRLREELGVTQPEPIRELAAELAATLSEASPPEPPAPPRRGGSAEALPEHTPAPPARPPAGRGDSGSARTPSRVRPRGVALAGTLVVLAVLGATALLPQRQGETGEPDPRSTGDLIAYDHYRQGTAYLSRQFSAEGVRAAVEQFEHAVARDPSFAAAWRRLLHGRLWLGWVFGEEEQRRRADAALERIVELDPSDRDVRLARAWHLYYGERRYREALDEFEALLEERPSDDEVLRAVGFLQARLGRWDEALATKRRTLERSPRDAEVAFSIAQTLRHTGRYRSALDYYDRAFSLAPAGDVAFLYSNVEHAYLGLGDTLSARMARERAWELGAPAWAAGRAELYAGDPAAAAERIASGPATHPFVRMARYDNLAFVHGLLGDSVRRELYADSLVALAAATGPDLTYAELGLSYRGLALIHLGHTEEGLRHVRRAVELAASLEDAQLGAAVEVLAARAHARTGRHDEAVALLGRVRAGAGIVSDLELRHDPDWTPLADHPRFPATLDRTGPSR